MSKITIATQINYAIIEKLLADLDNENSNLDLEIPIKFEFRGFGIMSNICLIIFKWMRMKKGKLIINVKIEDDKKIEEFGSSYFAFLTLSTLWTVTDIVDINGVNLKPKLRIYTKLIHDKIDFFQGLPNDEILIANFDHFSKEKGLSHWLYSDYENFAPSPSELQHTVYRAFEVLSKIYRTRFEAVSGKIIDDFEKLLWELLGNTDQHAIRDYLDKKMLSPNTRAVYFRILRSNQKNYIEYNSDDIPLSEYFKQVTEPEGDHFFFEVSVFDSGPGLARRFLGEGWQKSITTIDEINTIKKCFAKGSSSVNNWMGTNKGYGLNDVMKILTEINGFLRIRSNFSCTYRNLVSNPYTETTNFEEIELFDWNKDSSSEFSKMPFVEGTLLTMAFPLPSINF
ncbi:MAG: hypothetical protein QM535_20225 [Limnohabitans sp.]|nr:hypothetical protein [Limnohabitans sp.]